MSFHESVTTFFDFPCDCYAKKELFEREIYIQHHAYTSSESRKQFLSFSCLSVLRITYNKEKRSKW